MKKIYVSPVTEEQIVESGELMQASMNMYEDTVTGNDALSRELFNDQLFDEN